MEPEGSAQRLFDLKKKLANKKQEARDILDSVEEEERNLTDKEEKQYEKIMEEARGIKDKIEREMELLDLDEGEGVRNVIKNLPDNKDVRDNSTNKGDSPFRGLGEVVKLACADPRELSKKELNKRDMEMQTGESGGFLVPDEFMEDIMQVEPQDSIFRPRSTVIPAGDSPDAGVSMPTLDQTANSNMYGGVEVDWIGEGDEKSETDAELKEVKLDPNEVAAYIPVTDKLLRNAGAIENLAQNLLRGAILAAEDTAFYKGNGVGKPHGILEHNATIAENRDTANEINYEDIVEMYSSVKFGGSLVWVTTQTALPQLMQMEDTQGNLIWQPNAREGAPGNLLGIPVLLNERSETLGNKGDLTLMDPAYYLIKDGFGIELAASEHVYFKSNKTVIKATWNVDGQPWLSDPIQLEDGETEVSPFVVLDEPTGE